MDITEVLSMELTTFSFITLIVSFWLVVLDSLKVAMLFVYLFVLFVCLFVYFPCHMNPSKEGWIFFDGLLQRSLSATREHQLATYVLAPCHQHNPVSI